MKNLVNWDNNTIEVFLNECLGLLNCKLKQEIEKRVRLSTGSNSYKNACTKSHHNKGNLSYKFTNASDDRVGAFLEGLINPKSFVILLIGIAERGSKVYNRVLSNPSNPTTSLSKSDDDIIRKEILKESIIREIESSALDMVRKEHQSHSRHISQIALPSTKFPIDEVLEPSCIHQLIEKGFSSMNNFIGKQFCKGIFEELELLEYGGLFNEIAQHNNFRTDKTLFTDLSDLDRYKQPNLFHLLKKMSSIPYELNLKAKLGLQISSSFQLSYYHNNGSYYKTHMDNALDQWHDNGRKLTCIYYPNDVNRKAQEGGCLKVYSRQTLEKQRNSTVLKQMDSFNDLVSEVVPKGDTIVLFSSREIPHEITSNFSKRFSITLWIPGPPGSCNGF